MKKKTIALSLSLSLLLSAGVWADMKKPEYRVTDMKTHRVMFLEGIHHGHIVSHHRDMRYCHFKGDKITHLTTHRSGIITGVKDQGTTEVMMPSGRYMQYQYVTFKIKPMR